MAPAIDSCSSGTTAQCGGLSASALYEEDVADNSTLSAANGGGCDSARAALLALREEHIRLREANVKLKEDRLEKRKEIAALEDQCASLREEVGKLADLKKHHSQAILAARQKLSLCRRTIKQAVRAVDRAYGMPPQEDGEAGKNISCTPGSEPDKLSEIPSINSELDLADAAVETLIASLDGQVLDSVSSVAFSPHNGQEIISPVPQDQIKHPHHGQENMLATKDCKIKEDKALDDRAPTVAAAQQMQQQQPHGRTPLKAINV